MALPAGIHGLTGSARPGQFRSGSMDTGGWTSDQGSCETLAPEALSFSRQPTGVDPSLVSVVLLTRGQGAFQERPAETSTSGYVEVRECSR